MLVLLTVGAVVFFANDHAAKARLYAEIADYETYQQSQQREEFSGTMDIETFAEPLRKEPCPPQQLSVTEVKSSKGFGEKISIKIDKGMALLRPSQILYVTMENTSDKPEIVTTTLQRFLLKESITTLGRKLNQASSDNFITGRRELLNQSYIQAVTSERQSGSNYNYSVRMDDGKTVPVSEAVYSRIRAHLPSSSFGGF